MLSGARHLHAALFALTTMVLAGPALADDAQAEIAVADQRIESGGIVKVDKVTIPGNGFLVIHAAADGATAVPGPPIGYALLTPGSNTNVSVKLEKPVEPGQKLIAVLHEDTGKTGMFDPETAKPIARADGKTAMAAFVAK